MAKNIAVALADTLDTLVSQMSQGIDQVLSTDQPIKKLKGTAAVAVDMFEHIAKSEDWTIGSNKSRAMAALEGDSARQRFAEVLVAKIPEAKRKAEPGTDGMNELSQLMEDQCYILFEEKYAAVLPEQFMGRTGKLQSTKFADGKWKFGSIETRGNVVVPNTSFGWNILSKLRSAVKTYGWDKIINSDGVCMKDADIQKLRVSAGPAAGSSVTPLDAAKSAFATLKVRIGKIEAGPDAISLLNELMMFAAQQKMAVDAAIAEAAKKAAAAKQ